MRRNDRTAQRLIWLTRVACLVLIWTCRHATARVLHVPDEYSTVQSAIDAAVDGDEIVIAPGEYFEAIELLGKAVYLHGEVDARSTILNGIWQ